MLSTGRNRDRFSLKIFLLSAQQKVSTLSEEFHLESYRELHDNPFQCVSYSIEQPIQDEEYAGRIVGKEAIVLHM